MFYSTSHTAYKILDEHKAFESLKSIHRKYIVEQIEKVYAVSRISWFTEFLQIFLEVNIQIFNKYFNKLIYRILTNNLINRYTDFDK